MSTTEAIEFIPDNLDFVYVDARHDYCSVHDDIQAWWPKVRRGGFMSGHDFLTDAEVKIMTPQQDWSVCEDGSVQPGAVKKAVLDFVERENLHLYVTVDQWPSWIVRKP